MTMQYHGSANFCRSRNTIVGGRQVGSASAKLPLVGLSSGRPNKGLNFKP
jgi:hypothetical protein